MRGVGGNSQGFAPSFLSLCHSLERGEGDVSHTRICSSLSGALQSTARGQGLFLVWLLLAIIFNWLISLSDGDSDSGSKKVVFFNCLETGHFTLPSLGTGLGGGGDEMW